MKKPVGFRNVEWIYRMEVSNLEEYIVAGILVGIPIIYFILNIEWEDTDIEKKENAR